MEKYTLDYLYLMSLLNIEKIPFDFKKFFTGGSKDGFCYVTGEPISTFNFVDDISVGNVKDVDDVTKLADETTTLNNFAFRHFGKNTKGYFQNINT